MEEGRGKTEFALCVVFVADSLATVVVSVECDLRLPKQCGALSTILWSLSFVRYIPSCVTRLAATRLLIARSIWSGRRSHCACDVHGYDVRVINSITTMNNHLAARGWGTFSYMRLRSV